MMAPNFNKTSQSPWLTPAEDDDGSDSTPFKCVFTAATPGKSTDEWPVTICLPSISNARLISPLGDNSTYPASRAVNLVLNMTGTFDFLFPSCSPAKHADYIYNGTSFSLAVIVCYSSVSSKIVPVEASRDIGTYAEPSITWNNSELAYDTHDARQQLQVYGSNSAPSTMNDRGMFGMRNLSAWESPRLVDIPFSITDIALFETGGGFNTITLMCVTCILSPSSYANESDSDFPTQPHGKQIALYQDTLQDTRNPTVALQSYYTLLLFVTMKDVQMPTSKRFFAIFAIVRGRFILLGNSWATVGALWSSETEDRLKRADSVTGGTVRKWISTAKMDYLKVRIREIDGRLQVAKKIE
ncbi:uncharacterized protein PAC_10874 [Phialocephala subalpina]|uniref:Uncharacterized protein n=1 Tax=Phialocephala subalpina TaxID=576137 RepID=A0A1L7X7I3_9HELO|nr:uncharacterized protein PAC_10874 [Phialocephala subalpina]